MEEARAVFSDTNIKITAVGKNYLGGFIGRANARNDYLKDLVDACGGKAKSQDLIMCVSHTTWR